MRGLDDLRLRHQPGLLGLAVGDRPLVRGLACLDHAVGLGLRAGRHGLVLVLGVGDRVVGFGLGVAQQIVGVGAGLLHHPVRLRLRVGEHAIRVRAGVVESLAGLRVGIRDRLVGLSPRVPDELVAMVQNVLRVVQFRRQRVADVVEQIQYVAARDHAARGHRDTACFLDDRDQLVECLEYAVHAQPQSSSRRGRCDRRRMQVCRRYRPSRASRTRCVGNRTGRADPPVGSDQRCAAGSDQRCAAVRSAIRARSRLCTVAGSMSATSPP